MSILLVTELDGVAHRVLELTRNGQRIDHPNVGVRIELHPDVMSNPSTLHIIYKLTGQYRAQVWFEGHDQKFYGTISQRDFGE